MLETQGDLFTYGNDYAENIARVIPTNGDTNREGKAVMGRGVALQAASKYKSLPAALGALILSQGNHAHVLTLENQQRFVAFPTKHSWRDAADMKLIERSARETLDITDQYGFDLVVMPRVGAGLGNLPWEPIRDRLRILLDDRFVVVSLFDPDQLTASKKWMR